MAGSPPDGKPEKKQVGGKRKQPFFSEFFVGQNTIKFHCNILGLTAKSPSFLHLDILVFQKNLGGHFGLNFYFR